MLEAQLKLIAGCIPLAELAASGIPARRFDLHESGLMAGERDAVRVIKITKLVEEKRGGVHQQSRAGFFPPRAQIRGIVYAIVVV